MRATWPPSIAAAMGLAMAIGAGLVLLHAGVPGVAIAQTEIVGLSYVTAGAIAWRFARRRVLRRVSRRHGDPVGAALQI